ncbi:hypothetical protein BD289DRAFT_172548 [Coniella lustricola]|uniref:Uncharacterized protein n=1 Tax=Coniella lustricola TaxID=2025994 RepID=A0A2T2ZTT8_9PEZI|nr:hypothetical protein BD289DRAFT_172548 [Coniella lustricola]
MRASVDWRTTRRGWLRRPCRPCRPCKSCKRHSKARNRSKILTSRHVVLLVTTSTSLVPLRFSSSPLLDPYRTMYLLHRESSAIGECISSDFPLANRATAPGLACEATLSVDVNELIGRPNAFTTKPRIQSSTLATRDPQRTSGGSSDIHAIQSTSSCQRDKAALGASLKKVQFAKVSISATTLEQKRGTRGQNCCCKDDHQHCCFGKQTNLQLPGRRDSSTALHPEHPGWSFASLFAICVSLFFFFLLAFTECGILHKWPAPD